MKKVSLLTITIMMIVTLAACGSTKNNDEFDPSKTITLYTRDTSSGTRAGFMGTIDFKDAAENDGLLAAGFVIKDNTGILTSMATDEYGIGYISLSSLNNTVKGLELNGVAPTIENVINDTYGLKRPFNYIIREDWTGMEDEEAISKAFIAFLETTDGADVINDKGAISLPSTLTWDDIKADYPICSNNNSAIEIKFGGSDSIEKVAKALTSAFSPKCGNFIAEHDHTGSSDGFKRTQGSESEVTNANFKHVGFASRAFKIDGSEDMFSGSSGQLAWDAIVVIVHLNNPLEGLTTDEVKKVYSGDYKSWNEVLN